jgi:hypothetical protein
VQLHPFDSTLSVNGDTTDSENDSIENDDVDGDTSDDGSDDSDDDRRSVLR